MHPTSAGLRARSCSVPISAADAQAVASQSGITLATLRSARNVDAANAKQYSLPRTLRGYYNFAVSFLRAQKQCLSMAEADARFLPKLLASEAARHPGMRLSHHRSPLALVEYLVQRCGLPDAEGREQGIVNMGPDGIHFAAFDLAIRAGQPSLILIEPGSMNTGGGARLAYRLGRAMARLAPQGQDWPHRSLMSFETQTQQSEVDCGMFSLATSKTMFEESGAFESLHTRLRAGEFDEASAFDPFPLETSDALLPPSIMRHTQSSARLNIYAVRHALANEGAIAAMPELLAHQIEHTFARDDRTYSVSIEFERIKVAGRALPPPLESLGDTFLQDSGDDVPLPPGLGHRP